MSFLSLISALSAQENHLSYQLFGGVLMLQPNASNLTYAVEAIPDNFSLPDPLMEANWFDHEISPSYFPAFEVGAKFQFQSLRMNLVVGYERLSGTNIEHLSLPLSNAMAGPLFDIGPDAEPYIRAKGKAVFRFDQANLYLEKEFYDSCRWTLNLCAGTAFARIKEYMRTQYFSGGGAITRIIKSPSVFAGGGISSGGSFSFRLANHFQLTGSTAFSLLMGRMSNHTTYRSFSPDIATNGNPQPITERTRVPTRAQLVPSLEEKMSFTFDFPISCSSTFSLEAGYLFQIFFNAIQTFDITVIVTTDLPFSTTDGYYAQGFRRTLSNFILSGPYVNLNATF